MVFSWFSRVSLRDLFISSHFLLFSHPFFWVFYFLFNRLYHFHNDMCTVYYLYAFWNGVFKCSWCIFAGFWCCYAVFQIVGGIFVLAPPHHFFQMHCRKTELLEQDLDHLLAIDLAGKRVHLLGAGSVWQSTNAAVALSTLPSLSLTLSPEAGWFGGSYNHTNGKGSLGGNLSFFSGALTWSLVWHIVTALEGMIICYRIWATCLPGLSQIKSVIAGCKASGTKKVL